MEQLHVPATDWPGPGQSKVGSLQAVWEGGDKELFGGRRGRTLVAVAPTGSYPLFQGPDLAGEERPFLSLDLPQQNSWE